MIIEDSQLPGLSQGKFLSLAAMVLQLFWMLLVKVYLRLLPVFCFLWEVFFVEHNLCFTLSALELMLGIAYCKGAENLRRLRA